MTHASAPLTPAADLNVTEVSLASELKATIALAVPLALTQVGQLAMFTTDLALIGRLGDTHLAAAALAHTVLFAAFVIGMGLVSAVAPLTAQALGANDPQMIRRSLRVGLHATLIIGLPIVAAQLMIEPVLIRLGQVPEVAGLAGTYLSTLAWSVVPAWMFMAARGFMSALGAPNPGLWIMLAGIPVNAALAYVLIYGLGPIPALGLIGAGIATTAVNVAMCAAAVWVIAVMPRFAVHAPLVRLWRPDWEHFGKLIWVGGPIAVAFTLEHGLFMAATLLAGAISASALAAHQIAIQVASIIFMLPLGIGMAASVRVGEPFGAGNIARARRAGWVAMSLSAALAVVTTVATIAGRDLFALFFLGAKQPETADTHTLAALLMVYAAAFFVVDGIQCVANGALRGINDTRVPMLFALASFWLIGFPVSYVSAFPLGLGAPGIWIGLIAGLSIYAVFLVARYWALMRSNA